MNDHYQWRMWSVIIEHLLKIVADNELASKIGGLTIDNKVNYQWPFKRGIEMPLLKKIL